MKERLIDKIDKKLFIRNVKDKTFYQIYNFAMKGQKLTNEEKNIILKELISSGNSMQIITFILDIKWLTKEDIDIITEVVAKYSAQEIFDFAVRCENLSSKTDSDFENSADNGEGDLNNINADILEEKNEVNGLTIQIEPIKNVEEEQNYSDVANAVVSFIKSVCSLQGIIVKVDVKENKDDISLDITGENAKEIIGFRGEGLNALQYLCNIIAGKVDKNCPRIYVNVDNYKEEREQTLIKLARRLAYKCAKTKESIKLEPMTAYERKIVHKALQNDAYVTTHSEGEEPRRCLVIELKPKDK